MFGLLSNVCLCDMFVYTYVYVAQCSIGFGSHIVNLRDPAYPMSHIHGLDPGLATDVHSWQSVLARSFPSCIRNHT